MLRAGRIPVEETTNDTIVEIDKLVTDCVLEVVQMPCHNIKQLAAIRRTLKNVLKALVKERDSITIGVVKRYVEPKNRFLVKSILCKLVDACVISSTTIEDKILYQIDHRHANDIFSYLERVS